LVPRFQISIRTLLEITTAAAVVLGIIAWRGSNRSSRYQILQTTNYGVVLYDSQTGETWRQQGGNWVTLYGPAPPELKK
jgi:hypothetical protein